MYRLRRVAERLSRDVVISRRLPREFGSILLFVSPEGGGLKFWRWDLSSIDPPLLGSVSLLVAPGACVWDVGANMGLFTFAAAHRVGRSGSVLAIEPDVDNVRLLHRTRTSLPADCGRVDILPVAVNAGGCRVARLAISARARASNALIDFGRSQMGDVREVRTVAALRLDELLEHFDPPSVVKVDVEGAEADVVAGGIELLERHRPALIIEVGPGSAEQVGATLGGFDYEFYDAEVAVPLERALPLPPWSCIAIPRERRREFLPIAT